MRDSKYFRRRDLIQTNFAHGLLLFCVWGTCRLSVKMSLLCRSLVKIFDFCRWISFNFFVANRQFCPRFVGSRKYFSPFLASRLTLLIIQLSYTVRIPIFWLVDLYHVTLGYDATTSLTSLSWCNSHGVNSIHQCHYTMASGDSNFDDFCLQCIQFEW